MSTVLVQLGNDRQNVRKRATACVGAFAVVISDSLLHRLMESLLNQIEAQRKGRDVQTLIQVRHDTLSEVVAPWMKAISWP